MWRSRCDGVLCIVCSKRAASGPTGLCFWAAVLRRFLLSLKTTSIPRCPTQIRITCTGTAESQRAFRSSPTGETQKLTSARSASWIQTKTRVSFIPGALYNVLVSRQNPDAMSDEGKLKGKHAWKSENLNGYQEKNEFESCNADFCVRLQTYQPFCFFLAHCYAVSRMLWLVAKVLLCSW